MGWEYSDTDCKYANVCSFSPRCTAKSEKECNLYEKRPKRSLFEKIFCRIDYIELKRELEAKENK